MPGAADMADPLIAVLRASALCLILSGCAAAAIPLSGASTALSVYNEIGTGFQIADAALAAACKEWQGASTGAEPKAVKATAAGAAPTNAAAQIRTIQGFMQGACATVPDGGPVENLVWAAENMLAFWAKPSPPPTAAAHIAWVRHNTNMIRALTGEGP
jgi:hypothetical protein